MNSPKAISRVPQEPVRSDTVGEQLGPEADVWEPPFERWIQMADDLLRHWPHHGALPRENRV